MHSVAGPGRGAVVNFRIKPGDTAKDVLAHVSAVVNDPRVEIRLLHPESVQGPSRQSSVDSAAFHKIECTIRQVMPDVVVAPSLVVAATDTRHYEDLADEVYRFSPVVLGPEDTSRIHGTNERIAIDTYQNCVRFYVQLLLNESGPVLKKGARSRFALSPEGKRGQEPIRAFGSCPVVALAHRNFSSKNHARSLGPKRLCTILGGRAWRGEKLGLQHGRICLVFVAQPREGTDAAPEQAL